MKLFPAVERGISGEEVQRTERRKNILFLDKIRICAILLLVLMFLRKKETIIYIQKIN